MMKTVLKFSFAALCATLAVLPSDVGATRASLLDDICTHNTYMCCWTENDNGVEDNTDVCSLTTSQGTEVEYPNDEEGDVHCHGFVWAEDASYESFILPLFKFVRTFDHRDARGYYGSVKGAPQCECIETMPVVSRADCTTYSSQGLVPCDDNDLRTHYDGEMKKPGGKLDFNLVGDCNESGGGNGNGGGGGEEEEEEDTNVKSASAESDRGEGGETTYYDDESGGNDEEGSKGSEGDEDDMMYTMEGPYAYQGSQPRGNS